MSISEFAVIGINIDVSQGETRDARHLIKPLSDTCSECHCPVIGDGQDQFVHVDATVAGAMGLAADCGRCKDEAAGISLAGLLVTRRWSGVKGMIWMRGKSVARRKTH
ncbi:hypothetical protein VCV18_002104 [Metarhizium anisopliae]